MPNLWNSPRVYSVAESNSFREFLQNSAPISPYTRNFLNQLWEEEMYAEPKLVKQDRTLLYLVKKLKKDWNTLINNPSAFTWGWLETHLRTYKTRKKDGFIHNGRISQREQIESLFIDIEVRYLAILNKVAKKYSEEFIRINSSFQLKKNYKAYWMSGALVWISVSDWEDRKSQGSILWDPYIKDWCAASSFFAVKGLYNGRIQAIRKSFAKTPNMYECCPNCSGWWEPGSFKEKEEIDEKVCPECYDEPFTNEPFTLGEVFGEYHSHKHWKFVPQKIKNDLGFPMGVELEVQLKDTSVSRNLIAWEIYQQQMLLNPSWHNIYFERDGSLSDSSVEIVSNPMTLDFHKEYWEKMLPVIKKHCAGWDATKYNGGSHPNYGIHLTFHRKNWSDLHLARLIKFVELMGNQDFIRVIAQRVTNYGGKAIAGSRKGYLNEVVTFEKKKIKERSTRNQSVNVKSERLVEIRMFNSTLNHESFMKNIEFLDAFKAWCKETPLHFDYFNFLNWLGSKPHHKYRYENLISYLSRPHFYVKGLTNFAGKNQKIPNQFLHFVKGQRGQLNLFNEELTEDTACA